MTQHASRYPPSSPSGRASASSSPSSAVSSAGSSSAAAAAAPAGLPPPSSSSDADSKQNRITVACERCRKRHKRCHGGSPCLNCVRAKAECVYVEGERKIVVTLRYIQGLQSENSQLKAIIDEKPDSLTSSSSPPPPPSSAPNLSPDDNTLLLHQQQLQAEKDHQAQLKYQIQQLQNEVSSLQQRLSSDPTSSKHRYSHPDILSPAPYANSISATHKQKRSRSETNSVSSSSSRTFPSMFDPHSYGSSYGGPATASSSAYGSVAPPSSSAAPAAAQSQPAPPPLTSPHNPRPPPPAPIPAASAAVGGAAARQARHYSAGSSGNQGFAPPSFRQVQPPQTSLPYPFQSAPQPSSGAAPFQPSPNPHNPNRPLPSLPEGLAAAAPRPDDHVTQQYSTSSTTQITTATAAGTTPNATTPTPSNAAFSSHQNPSAQLPIASSIPPDQNPVGLASDLPSTHIGIGPNPHFATASGYGLSDLNKAASAFSSVTDDINKILSSPSQPPSASSLAPSNVVPQKRHNSSEDYYSTSQHSSISTSMSTSLSTSTSISNSISSASSPNLSLNPQPIPTIERNFFQYTIRVSRFGQPQSLTTFNIPPLDIALKHLDSYHHYLGQSYYIINHGRFRAEIEALYANPDHVILSPATLANPREWINWAACFLIVMAIGELYEYNMDKSAGSVRLPSFADPRSQQQQFYSFPGYKYFANANHLVSFLIEGMPQLHQQLLPGEVGSELLGTVQALALASFYFTLVDAAAPQYAMSGLTTRYAVCLGLHRGDDASGRLSRHEIEHRRRLWWTIYMTDRAGAAKSGFPLSLSDDFISTPKPSRVVPADDSEPSLDTFEDESYLSLFVFISQITSTMLSFLYHPNRKPDVLAILTNVLKHLFSWRQNLPFKVQVDYSADTLDIKRHIANLHCEYFQCINLTIRPVLLYFVRKRLVVARSSSSSGSCPVVDLSQYSKEMLALLSATFQASIQTIRSLQNLHEKHELPVFAFFDREFLTSSISTLLLFNAAFGVNSFAMTQISAGLSLLEYMALGGNVKAEQRRDNLLNLINTLERHGVASYKEEYPQVLERRQQQEPPQPQPQAPPPRSNSMQTLSMVGTRKINILNDDDDEDMPSPPATAAAGFNSGHRSSSVISLASSEDPQPSTSRHNSSSATAPSSSAAASHPAAVSLPPISTFNNAPPADKPQAAYSIAHIAPHHASHVPHSPLDRRPSLAFPDAYSGGSDAPTTAPASSRATPGSPVPAQQQPETGVTTNNLSLLGLLGAESVDTWGTPVRFDDLSSHLFPMPSSSSSSHDDASSMAEHQAEPDAAPLLQDTLGARAAGGSASNIASLLSAADAQPQPPTAPPAATDAAATATGSGLVQGLATTTADTSVLPQWWADIDQALWSEMAAPSNSWNLDDLYKNF